MKSLIILTILCVSSICIGAPPTSRSTYSTRSPSSSYGKNSQLPTRSYSTKNNTHYYNGGKYLGSSYSTKNNTYYNWKHTK